MIEIEQLQKYAKNNFSSMLGIKEIPKLDFQLIGQGEYNINYAFTNPTNGKKLVLRITTGSQMHLEKQIEYEYKALKLLEDSKRTPKVFYVDSSKKSIDFGVLVMEFLPGKELDYNTDLMVAAECLADIHCTKLPYNNHLIKPSNPLEAILEECEQMSSVYFNYDDNDYFVENKIKNMISAVKKFNLKQYKDNNYLLNTELNSGNFLINSNSEYNYVIDWEKPIIGEVAQDIAHFLAPTTTFWKTDVILTEKDKAHFVDEYIAKSNGRIKINNLHERVKIYELLTCLRGITWCSMAWVEYQNPKRIIKNEFTYQKIQSYLSEQFLTNIENEYFAFI